MKYKTVKDFSQRQRNYSVFLFLYIEKWYNSRLYVLVVHKLKWYKCINKESIRTSRKVQSCFIPVTNSISNCEIVKSHKGFFFSINFSTSDKFNFWLIVVGKWLKLILPIGDPRPPSEVYSQRWNLTVRVCLSHKPLSTCGSVAVVRIN